MFIKSKKTVLLIAAILIGTVGFAQQERTILISTNKGDMKVKLYNDTPRHRDYFLSLIKKGYFDGTLFGRSIQQFIIQGGSQDSRGVKPGTLVGDGDRDMEIPHEIRSNHIPKKGALACPRRDVKVNPNKDSDMSMFFIVEGRPYTQGQLDTLELVKNVPIKKRVRAELYPPLKPMLDSLKRVNPAEFNKNVRALNHRIDSITRATPGSLTFTKEERKAYTTVGGSLHLKNEYTFFGEIVEGLDVIEKISSIPTDGNDRPKEDVVMKVTILN
ncbi:MAG: peptidylprolyl isomerase [Bacteroidales bacterium]|nr:peptidylprolyl isomerase [Bacteroidales bacterium]